MAPGTETGNRQSGFRERAVGWFRWLGLPDYPGILVFFLSVALSHHVYDILRNADYEDLYAESLEAAVLGIAATGIAVALLRRLAVNPEAVLTNMSRTLLPGFLFIFAPFRYAQVCRWTGWCQYWTDAFVILGIAGCAAAGLYTWWTAAHRRADPGATRARALSFRIPGSRLFVTTWVLCLLLLAWRGYGRLTHPELFAEGGRFVVIALTHGWTSLGFVYDGFYHTVPRLVALLATSLVPVAHIPAFTTTASFLIAAAICAFIARPVFRWIIPSDAVRVAAALLLCLVPALREILGHLAAVHYLLVVLLALLILKDPGKPYRLWEMLLAALVVLSSGLAAALAPALAVRLWVTLYARPAAGVPLVPGAAAREIALAGIVFALVSINALVVLSGVNIGRDEAAIDAFEPAKLLSAWGVAAAGYFLLHPFGGTVAVSEIMRLLPLSALVLTAGLVYAGMFRTLAGSRGREHAALIGAWLTSPFVLIGLLALLRHPGLQMFLLDEHWFHFSWWMRYNYLLAVFGIASWLLLLSPSALLPGRRLANIVVFMLCAAYASQANWYFDIPAYGTEYRWQQTAGALERAVRTGCPRRVVIKLYPGDWEFTYHATKANPVCRETVDWRAQSWHVDEGPSAAVLTWLPVPPW